MKLMGLEVTHPKPRTSTPSKLHKVYPYLLRDLIPERANQVWVSDITYLPMAKGFAYLVAVMDLYSRKILSWRLSNTLDSRFCVEALEEALRKYGKPNIFNTDQGAQFSARAFTGVLELHNIQISMDGKGRWIDNVFIERFWRSLKYEEVYLYAYDDLKQTQRGVKRYMRYYNRERCHSSLDKKTPQEVYAASAKSKLKPNQPVRGAALTPRPCS